MLHYLLSLGLLLIIGALGSASAAPPAGDDLVPVFRRAAQGGALRAVAIGGSITQAGGGWVFPWLRAQFPQSAVTGYNAGMSGTGSGLGVFRLERDVIACQPDLVFIEFAVNDGYGGDASVIRDLETLVVRLKMLPHPPAIVFLEAAAEYPLNVARHQKVAAHYGLLDIDLNAAVHRHLAEGKLPWSALMGDDVHPHEKGHAFYAATIQGQLLPFIERARSTAALPAPRPLPKPLSTKPLLLDARMMPIAPGPGWGLEVSVPFWWSRFFNGVVGSSTPGATLALPVRGTTVGLFLLYDESYGVCYVSVDGARPIFLKCHSRAGYGSPIFAGDLPAQEHLLNVVVARPTTGTAARPVKLGYVLVAGESQATTTLAPQGEWTAGRLGQLQFLPGIPARHWMFIGPFGGEVPTRDVTADLHSPFPPEAARDFAQNYPGYQGKPVAWQRLTGDGELIDCQRLTGLGDRGVSYACTRVWLERPQELLCWLLLDYFGKVWVNGALVHTAAGIHGGPKDPIVFPVAFTAGWNEILIKVHSGSKGNNCSFSLQKPQGEVRWMGEGAVPAGGD
jgi:lysophospholipase L1-like esterase